MSRRNHNRWYVPPLLISLVICGALSLLHIRAERMRHGDPVNNVVRDAALVPGLTVTARMNHWWRLHVISLFHAPRLAAQNATLAAENLNLKSQIKQLQEAQVDNDRLRALLDFEKKSPRPLLACEVIALKPSAQFDTLTINRGAASGIHQSSVVVAPDGALVGQVLTVTSRTSDVLLLTDEHGGAGAQVEGQTLVHPTGVCSADQAGRLHLIDLAIDAPVVAGDAVTTSGLGGIYPKDIPIGTVVSVSVDQQLSMKNAIVRPAADIDGLDQVFVIR